MTETHVSEHPLGPWISVMPLRQVSKGRLLAGMVLAGSVSLLSVAAWLHPDPSGFGTHRQLGFPACTSLALTGYPCPTCGMTTAFAHTVRGQLGSAFMAQPAGMLLAIGTFGAGIISVFTLITGQVPTVNWYRISPSWVVFLFVAVILLGWLFKIVTGRASGVLPVG